MARNEPPLLGPLRGAVSQITTGEEKLGLLLIEVFRKLINPQIDGHLDHLQGAIFLFIRALDKRSYLLIRGTQIKGLS